MYANCEAVLWVARTSASWQYLPDYNGPWSSAYSFFWRSWLMLGNPLRFELTLGQADDSEMDSEQARPEEEAGV
ncbi:transposase [Paenibacillus polymyxa]|nr:transposase [Paenibacillus polymyxa]